MSLIETEELVKKIEDTISWYRVHSSMIMERQLNYDKEIEALTTMMSCVVQIPTVDAIPIEWIEEYTRILAKERDKYIPKSYDWRCWESEINTLTDLIYDWKAEQVEQND